MSESILKDKAKIVACVVYAACGIVAVAAAATWAHPCTGVLELANGNAVPMRCFYTAKIAMLLGGTLAVLGVLGAVLKKDYSIPALLVSGCMVAITFDSLVGIGVCKSEMACWTTASWIRGLGAVSIVSTIAGMILSGSRKRVR